METAIAGYSKAAGNISAGEMKPKHLLNTGMCISSVIPFFNSNAITA